MKQLAIFLLAGNKFTRNAFKTPRIYIKCLRTIYKKTKKHEMAYEDLKDLRRRTASDKILCDNAFNMAKKSKCDGYQRGLASMVHTFFENKSVSVADKSASSGAIQNENISNKELAEELHKPII